MGDNPGALDKKQKQQQLNAWQIVICLLLVVWKGVFLGIVLLFCWLFM